MWKKGQNEAEHFTWMQMLTLTGKTTDMTLLICSRTQFMLHFTHLVLVFGWTQPLLATDLCRALL